MDKKLLLEVEYTRLSDIWISEDYLSSLYEVFIKFPQEQGLQMQSEVCVMVDEELSFWDASYGNLTDPILSRRFSVA